MNRSKTAAIQRITCKIYYPKRLSFLVLWTCSQVLMIDGELSKYRFTGSQGPKNDRDCWSILEVIKDSIELKQNRILVLGLKALRLFMDFQ